MPRIIPRILTGVLLSALVLVAHGQVFVTNTYSPFSVGEFSPSGTLVNATLLNGTNSSLGLNPYGIAVSGSTLFVANYGLGTVGEYTTSGGLINSTLVTGLANPTGIAVSGSTLYVVSNITASVTAYTVSGNSATPLAGFTTISGLGNSLGIAVSGNNLYVSNYADSFGNTPNTGSISVYDAMTGATLNLNAVSGLDAPVGLAASGTTVYAAMNWGQSVGAYTISGSNLTNGNNAFITTGYGNGAYGVALGSSGLYVLTQNSYGGGTIGLYNPTTGVGGIIDSSYLSYPVGIAAINAVAVPEPATWSTIAGALGLLVVGLRRRQR